MPLRVASQAPLSERVPFGVPSKLRAVVKGLGFRVKVRFTVFGAWLGHDRVCCYVEVGLGVWSCRT